MWHTFLHFRTPKQNNKQTETSCFLSINSCFHTVLSLFYLYLQETEDKWICWRHQGLFKIKEQANYIIGDKPTVITTVLICRDCKPRSKLYNHKWRNKNSIIIIMITTKYWTYTFSLQHTVAKIRYFCFKNK